MNAESNRKLFSATQEQTVDPLPPSAARVPGSWKEAFWASPGPRSIKEAALLSVKGLCMGSADIIPGVSGGTIALVTGIYENLLRAIRSIDLNVARALMRLDFKAALAQFHLRFLLALFSGIGLAILSLARVINFLLHNQPVLIWSLFFGLISASIWVVGRKAEPWNPVRWLVFALGAVGGFWIVNLIPMSTPEQLWFVFLSGLIAICAMILPGISGAFILLILGKYEFITATLRNPFQPENLLILSVFCTGCLCGLLAFSRVLNYLLDRYRASTLACLTGVMAGSLQKIWPWKEVLETRIIHEKSHVIWGGNVLPGAVDREFWLALVLAAAGFALVIILETISRENR